MIQEGTYKKQVRVHLVTFALEQVIIRYSPWNIESMPPNHNFHAIPRVQYIWNLQKSSPGKKEE